jgi:hypothetical protein
MKHLAFIAAGLLGSALLCAASAQDVPTFKTESESAFVWGEDRRDGAESSTVTDPLTGNKMYKLTFRGIEVSTRIGWQKYSEFEGPYMLASTTTVTNSTDDQISVRYGGTNINGHVAALVFSSSNKKLYPRKERQFVWEISKMKCFTTGYLSSERMFNEVNDESGVQRTSPSLSSVEVAIAPKRGVSLSSVVLFPETRTVCSDGCYPEVISIRQWVRVRGKDFVFVWPNLPPFCGE